MTSGLKAVVFNSRERVLSTDHNLTQVYLSNGMLEMLRHQLFDVSQSISTAPMKAEVLDGLLVLPQTGTLDLKVTAGAMVSCEAPAIAGESILHYARLASDLSTGVISLVANASGSTRIDIIECQRTSLTTISESRDIFDPATGLAAAATVPKFIESTLTFRVRAGTAGSGMPALAAGWLPICVVSMPTGTTSVNGCNFWDVRPLITDRVGSAKSTTANGTQAAEAERRNVTGTYSLSYQYSGPAIPTSVNINSGNSYFTTDGRAAGGVIGSYCFDPINDVSGLVNGQFCYLHACFPAGLPRWQQYTGLVPNSSNFRGLLIWSSNPILPPSLPPRYSFGATGLSGMKSTRIAISTTTASQQRPAPILVVDGYSRFGAFQLPSPGSGVTTSQTFSYSTSGGSGWPACSEASVTIYKTYAHSGPPAASSLDLVSRSAYLTDGVNQQQGADDQDEIQYARTLQPAANSFYNATTKKYLCPFDTSSAKTFTFLWSHDVGPGAVSTWRLDTGGFASVTITPSPVTIFINGARL